MIWCQGDDDNRKRLDVQESFDQGRHVRKVNASRLMAGNAGHQLARVLLRVQQHSHTASLVHEQLHLASACLSPYFSMG